MITYEQNDQAGTIVMENPPVNAIDDAFVAQMHAALDKAEAAGPTVLAIRSKQKVFCAGADLAMIAGLFDDPDGTPKMQAYTRSLHKLFDRIAAFPAVTLAVINGAAMGGGLELALSCDMRIVSTAARIGLPEARVGMIPGAGGTQRLTRLCGPGVSSRLILGGELIDGQEAARLGVAQWAVEPDNLDGFCDETTTRISELSRQALVQSKDCIAAFSDPNRDGFAVELEKPAILMPTDEARDRVLGFFKR